MHNYISGGNSHLKKLILARAFINHEVGGLGFIVTCLANDTWLNSTWAF